ncbi:Major Facilitator Superfamily protein [Gracilibacillus ureilyticus]|uniref:Major Facilitator Superfamily protein n=2 Tax=Gracilibacillus ureilyticus TaxID=531814 RepID=A0A1H9MJL9_9BACI|nr:Major Facilitator Superfamily protein [Gracilibacillus ureilyticus]
MKDFMMIWAGNLVSSVGSGMTAFAVAVYVYQGTGSATWVSIATLLAYLPTILLSPVGGILADRYDRRLMMICGDSLSVIGLLVIFFSVQTGDFGIPAVLLGVTISSIFGSLLGPAYKATVTDLLTEEQYAKASGMIQISGASKYLLSPFLAGIILSFSDIKVILLIDMATVFVTVVAVALVRKHIPAVKKAADDFNFFREFNQGMKSITANKGVSSLVWLMAFMCFFVAFIQTLMAPMLLAFTDAKTLGFIESVSAVGMLVGSIIIGIFNIKYNFPKILTISLMAAGVFMAMTGTTTNVRLITVFCFLFFMALPFINTCADVLIRRRIPNELQGRAWGMISVLTQVGYIVAYAGCGLLADYFFAPMLMEDGILARSIGQWIGTGEGRGIGFMLMITGISMFGLAFVFGSTKSITEMRGTANEVDVS